MPELGKLTAVFDADTRQFDAGMRNVQTKIATGITQIQSITGTTNTASTALTGLSSKFGLMAGSAVLAASAIGGVVTGLAALVQSAAKAAGGLFDLSQKTSFTVRTLSALSIVAENTGSSIEAISGSLVIFQQNMGAAQDATSKQAQLFRRLNIDTLDNEKALRQAFTVLAKYGDTAEGVSLATQLFGRSGAAVLAMIKETNGNLDEAIKKYSELGLVISDEAAQASDQFNDLLKITSDQLTAVTRQIGFELLPTVNAALGDISAGLARNKGDWVGWGATIGGVIQQVRIVAAGAAATLSTLFNTGSPGAATVIGAIGAFGKGRQISQENSIGGGASIGAGILRPRGFGGGGGGGGGRGGGAGGSRTAATTGAPSLFRDLGANIESVEASFRQIAIENQKILSDILHTPVESIEALINLYQTISGGFEGAAVGGVSTATEELRKLVEQGAPDSAALDQQVEARERIRQVSADLADNLTGIFADSIATGFEEGAKRGLVSLAQGLLNVVEQVFLRRLSEGLANALSGVAFGGTNGGWGSRIANFALGVLGGAVGGGSSLLGAGRSIGPLSTSGTPLLTGLIHRASGGSVYPGQPYLVGERGPEMFMPGQSGNIVPNGAGQTIVINVPVKSAGSYSSPKSRRELAQQIANAVQGAL